MLQIGFLSFERLRWEGEVVGKGLLIVGATGEGREPLWWSRVNLNAGGAFAHSRFRLEVPRVSSSTVGEVEKALFQIENVMLQSRKNLWYTST